MIRKLIDIFIPEQLNGNYFLPTTHLALQIKEETITGTVVTLDGKKITIKKVLHQAIEKGKTNRSTRIAVALKTLLQEVGPYHKLITALPSAVAMTKKIQLPFSDPEKIQMVLPYEIEALLPFPLHEAQIDFLITQTAVDKSYADILVAAVQKKYIDEYLKPFIEAKIEVSTITLDTIGLYNLYLRSTGKKGLGNIAFVDFDQTSTKILFFTDGYLQHIRTLRQGIESYEDDQFWQSINFTLQSFADENRNDQKIKTVTLLGIDKKELIDQATKAIGFPSVPFSIQNFLTQAEIIVQQGKNNITSDILAIALPLSDGRSFTLQPKSFTSSEASRLNRQTITAVGLTLATLALLALHSFRQISLLSSELQLSQQQIVKTLKTHFPDIKTKRQRDALDLARKEVKKEEAIWSSFSTQTRQSFLRYFYDLSVKIDRETLGLHLNKMIITKNMITLEGSVRSFEAVEQFEQQLRETKLFSSIPDMQKVQFSIQLPLDTKGGL
jgi:Tfp pilus assembly PilM family ATPase